MPLTERLDIPGRIDRLQKNVKPLGFAYAVIKKFGEDGGGRLAATMSYYAFFSIFPALLALVGITGFVLRDNDELRAEIVTTAAGQFPVIGESISTNALEGSTIAVVIGIATALWAGLGLMIATEAAFNTVWSVPAFARPNAVMSRLRGLLMFLIVGAAFVGAALMTSLVTSATLPGISKIGIALGNVAVNVAIAIGAFQVLTERHLRWRSLVPGAVLAGAGIYVLQTMGGVLIDRYVTNASDTYGTFALVIGLLTWFYLASQVTLIGAEVNVVAEQELHPRTMFGDDLTEADRRALRDHQRAAARDERLLPVAGVDV